jgi:amino acid transporter
MSIDSRLTKFVVPATAMLSFISFWRAAAIVLCDLGSSAYYVGGIAEKAIGKAAPWFVLAIMLFSYAVRAVYIESCSMFVRGGVYKVVREAMGSPAAKFSVSALLFDYVLTGPISGVSAGLYLAGLLNEAYAKRVADPRAIRVFSKAIHIAEKLGKPLSLVAVPGRNPKRVILETAQHLNSARVLTVCGNRLAPLQS